jgi:hypothetical protein
MHYRNWKVQMEERIMRTLTTIAATLGVIGAIAVGSAVPAAAWYGYHHRYYHHYGVLQPGFETLGWAYSSGQL